MRRNLGAKKVVVKLKSTMLTHPLRIVFVFCCCVALFCFCFSQTAMCFFDRVPVVVKKALFSVTKRGRASAGVSLFILGAVPARCTATRYPQENPKELAQFRILCIRSKVGTWSSHLRYHYSCYYTGWLHTVPKVKTRATPLNLHSFTLDDLLCFQGALLGHRFLSFLKVCISHVFVCLFVLGLVSHSFFLSHTLFQYSFSNMLRADAQIRFSTGRKHNGRCSKGVASPSTLGDHSNILI